MVNAIIEFVCMSETLKLGIMIPMFKGGGKDPLAIEESHHQS